MSLRALNRWLSSVWTSGATPGRRPARTATPRVEALEARDLMAAGALDTTFGKVTRSLDLGGTRNDFLADMALQADGKIVAVGTADRSSNGGTVFAVLRFNANGSLDRSFGNFGRQLISFGGKGFDKASAVAIDRFGRIVVAGTSDRNSGDNDFAVARLTPNGQLDTSFDGDGKRTVAFDLGDEKDDQATDVAIDAQGRIVVGGFAEFGRTGGQFAGIDYDFAVARLNANGSLDTSFDGDGKRTFGFDLSGHDRGADNADFARSLAIDSAGRIVIAGSAANHSQFNTVMAVARLTPGGKLDTTFSGDGKQTVAFGPIGVNDASAVAIDPRGRIVLAGTARVFSGQGNDMAVARLLANGSLDTSFDGDGKATIAYENVAGGFEAANALAIDSRGRIVLAGQAQRNSAVNGLADSDMAVVRLNDNGSIDPFFAHLGRATINFADALPRGNPSFASAVALDAQGRIVVGGSAKFFSPDFDFALARLLSDQGLSAHPLGGGQVLLNT